MSRLRVAIGEQLKGCPQVVTLGVRPQIGDYTVQERELLRAADVIFYPTARFVDLFASLGKETFPSINCYRLRGDRLKQIALLHMLEVHYPRTRVYYGHKQKQKILEDFAFPVIAKIPFGSAPRREVFFLEDRERLEWYKQNCNPAYIQRYITPELELRVVVFNYNKVFGYWRTVAGGDSQGNPTQAGAWQTEGVHPDAIALAKNIARKGKLSDVAVEMIFDGSRFWVLELNFQYDEMGDLYPGQDRRKLILELIEQGEL